MTLEEIGRKNFTEKVGHGYLPIYERLWKHLQYEPITLLEIGIYNGNSMRTWCEWFPNATIVGIDHNPSNPMKTDRAKLHFGRQENIQFLDEVWAQYPEGFDIIIDDGSHKWKDQQITFKHLWYAVKSGGMYIIEDLHTSDDIFWGNEWEQNTVDFLKQFVDDIIYDDQPLEMFSMEIYKKMVVIHKR